MSTIIKTIKDFFDNTVYPITKTNAVYDSNNNRLDNVLASKQDASSNFVYKGTGSATPSIYDPELRQSDISTTQSTSDTTVPSSSLVKTMNDNLGNPSSASAVTGADAFSKISKLNSDLASMIKVDSIRWTTAKTIALPSINNLVIIARGGYVTAFVTTTETSAVNYIKNDFGISSTVTLDSSGTFFNWNYASATSGSGTSASVLILSFGNG